MTNGLRYETGRDMPPGMQELAAVQLSRQLQEAATVAGAVAQEMERQKEIATPVCGLVRNDRGCDEGALGNGVPPMTNGDRIRSMSNEELEAKLFWAYQVSVEHDCGDIAALWCDMQGGCCGAGGEELDCDEDKHKACILRWLESEVAG